MFSLSLILCLLPNLGLKILSGTLPIRYVSMIFFAKLTRFPIQAKYFFYAALLHLFYPLVTLSVDRPLSTYDLGIAIMYCWVPILLVIVRRRMDLFLKFFKWFLVANCIYAFLQAFLMTVGVPSWAVLLHQNSHSDTYQIPFASFFPYLPRYTGLFIESAPFVVYLSISYLILRFLRYAKIPRLLALLTIAFSGSKLGVLMIAIIALYNIRLFSFISLTLVKFIVVMVSFLLLLLGPHIVHFFTHVYPIGSISLRLRLLIEAWGGFFEEPLVFMFGAGAVTTSSMVNDGEVVRGLDFFSSFVLSFGVIGSCILLFPLYLFFSNVGFILQRNEKKCLIIAVFLCLMTLGSLMNFQYSLLFAGLFAIYRVRSQ